MPKPLSFRRQKSSLGDMLQKLALLAPEKISALTVFVRYMLRQTEQEFRRRFHRDPWEK